MPETEAPKKHYYRLELSGGHTGSAFRYHSGVFGTLAECKRALIEELSDPQGLAFVLAESPTLAIEYYEDGAQQGAWSAFPAVKLRLAGGEVITFKRSGRPAGIEIDPADDVMEHPILGPVLEGETPAEPEVDFGALKLPAPRGEPVTRGKAIAIERNGAGEIQVYGWVGGWNESGRKPYRLAAAKSAKRGE